MIKCYISLYAFESNESEDETDSDREMLRSIDPDSDEWPEPDRDLRYGVGRLRALSKQC